MPSGPDASSRSIRAHRPWPYHPPWTPAGKGSKGWVRRAATDLITLDYV